LLLLVRWHLLMGPLLLLLLLLLLRQGLGLQAQERKGRGRVVCKPGQSRQNKRVWSQTTRSNKEMSGGARYGSAAKSVIMNYEPERPYRDFRNSCRLQNALVHRVTVHRNAHVGRLGRSGQLTAA